MNSAAATTGVLADVAGAARKGRLPIGPSEASHCRSWGFRVRLWWAVRWCGGPAILLPARPARTALELCTVRPEASDSLTWGAARGFLL